MRFGTAAVLSAFILVFAGAAGAAEPLVDVAWVKANIGKPGVVFLDVRSRIAGMSKANFLRGHIPGAVYTNYLRDGWRIKDKKGIVGQFPGAAKLEKLIGKLGISNDSHVVIVPAGNRALDVGTATRIYWTFKVLGHDKVSILDGGMNAYTAKRDKKGKPLNALEKGKSKHKPATFKANFRSDMVITKADVKKALDAGVRLVDNRPNNQYLGVNRHGMAKRNGTIPGAKNIPENWITKNGGGTFRSTATLKNLYAAAGVKTDEIQINFCNTGHWASLGWFVASELMGNKQAKMYDGSMVEWSADKSLPMEVKVDSR